MSHIFLIDPVSPLRTVLQQQAVEWRRRLMNPPDPNAPAGPPPSFDVTPIEQLHQRARAGVLDPAETAMADPARTAGRPRIDLRL